MVALLRVFYELPILAIICLDNNFVEKAIQVKRTVPSAVGTAS